MYKLYIFISLILLSYPTFSQAISFSYDAAGNRIKRNSACDLTPTMDIDGLIFSANAKRDFIVNIFEINNTETTGTISIRISKLSVFAITYSLNSGISNVFGGKQNQNSNWNFSEDANFITLTSKAGVKITSGGQAVIGFNVARKNGFGPGTSQNISAVILGGSGGEAKSSNNQSIVTISTN